MFKNLCKKLQLFVAATLVATTVTGISVQAAENIDYQAYYNATNIDVSNKNDLIYVKNRDEDKLLFVATPCYEKVYTTERLNLRDVPNIGSNVVCTLPKNAEILKVGDTNVRWDIIQIEGINYFMWDEFLSDKADETIDIIPVDSITPYVHKAAQPSGSDSSVDNSNSGGAAATYTSGTVSTGSSYLGTYVLTAYCNCSTCCGQWAGGATASGTYPVAGRTVAADLPFGTQLLINGNIYTVEDRGVSGNHIDIYFNSHSEALAFGMQYADVYIP